MLVVLVVPNAVSYQTAIHLPSGVISILLSMIPMLAFPIALGFGLDRFEMRRLLGPLARLCGLFRAKLTWPKAILRSSGRRWC